MSHEVTDEGNTEFYSRISKASRVQGSVTVTGAQLELHRSITYQNLSAVTFSEMSLFAITGLFANILKYQTNSTSKQVV